MGTPLGSLMMIQRLTRFARARSPRKCMLEALAVAGIFWALNSRSSIILAISLSYPKTFHKHTPAGFFSSLFYDLRLLVVIYTLPIA
jgi:hypothetical protein